MKTSILLALLPLALASVVAMVTARTLILSREKRQNYDALLQNKAFVESQINCVLGKGQCDRIGHRIKILVPEVVKTKECKSCTDDERVNVQKVAEHVKIHYPKEWNEIKDQFTPEEEEEQEEEEGVEEEEVIEVDGSGEEVVVEEEEEKPQKQQKQLKKNDNNNNSSSKSHDDTQDNSNEPEENTPESQEKQDKKSDKKTTSKEDIVETSTSN